MKISNYDKFALLVEAGSSLGLWVGLSIIGIADLIIDLWKSNDWCNKKKKKVSQVSISMYDENQTVKRTAAPGYNLKNVHASPSKNWEKPYIMRTS